MEIMFLTNVDSYVIGYTQYPIPDTIPEYNYVFEVEEEVLNEYMHYKVVDGIMMRMEDDEYNALYPPIIPEPTTNEILGQAITQGELERMELAQRITDVELMVLEGGTSDV